MQNWCHAISKEKLREIILNDTEMPFRYRVNVVLGNMAQFAEVFHCPVGSKMNPASKCAVW